VIGSIALNKFIAFIISTKWLFFFSNQLRKISSSKVGAAMINSKLVSRLPRESHTTEINLGSIHMVYHSNSYDDLNLLSRNNLYGWETESIKWFTKFSKESNTIVDVGAYTGIYSVIAALSNPSSEVFCFEPNPKIIPNLKENITLNDLVGRVVIECYALSNAISSGRLNYHDTWSSMNSVSSADHGFGESELIQVTTLDSYFVNKKVDLIKVDIEGAELNFLRGARRVLKEDKPILLMEALDASQLESQRSELSAFGYRDPIVCGTSFADRRNFLWLHKDMDWC
jgi:FkbM family methyltransferase